MPWSNTTSQAKTWTAGSGASSYGWWPLSVESSPFQDIGVGFSITASDFHGAFAFDDFRGFAAHDSSLSPPP